MCCDHVECRNLTESLSNLGHNPSLIPNSILGFIVFSRDSDEITQPKLLLMRQTLIENSNQKLLGFRTYIVLSFLGWWGGGRWHTAI